MGELHLDILVDRLKREFKVEANIGAPQVAYRETIGHEVEHTYTHKKQSGGSGQFAEVKMIITPTEPGEGYSFESRIVGGSRCRRNTSPASKRASSRSWTPVRSPASRSSTSRSRSDRRQVPRRGLQRFSPLKSRHGWACAKA